MELVARGLLTMIVERLPLPVGISREGLDSFRDRHAPGLEAEAASVLRVYYRTHTQLPDRATLVERIVQAARHARRPMPDIREVQDVRGTDGKWYFPFANGFPVGVTATGEHSDPYYLYYADGAFVGPRASTRQELIDRHRRREDEIAEDFRAWLESQPDARLLEDAAFYKVEVPGTSPRSHEPYTLEEHRAFIPRLRRGELTIEEYQTTWARFVEHEGSIRRLLDRQLLAELRKRFPRITARSKVELIDKVIDALVRSFKLQKSEFITDVWAYARDRRPEIERMADVVASTTQADLDAVAAEHGEQTAWSAKWDAEKEARRARADAPVTLEDFQIALAERGIANLTPDERQRYDALKAAADFEAQRRQAKTIEAADLPGTAWEVVESFHTKQQVPLFVVKRVDEGERLPRDIFDDLNDKAKALRGRYSSYRKDGAIPGFVFFDRGAAEKFLQVARGEAAVSNAEEIAASEKFRAERRAASLEARAEAIEERAEDVLSADRKTNTRTRLEEARRMEGAARRELRIADSLERIAERIKDGSARYLSRLNTRTQLEALEDLLREAKYKRPKDEPDREGPPRMTDIPRVEYPWPALHQKVLRDVQSVAERTPGAKQAGQRLARRAREVPGEQVVFRSERDLELLETLASRLRGAVGDRVRGELADFKRMQSAGITTPEILREALREYLLCCRGETPTTDIVREAERDVVLQDIAGFFPTPVELADEVVAKAALVPEMRVLEPSAGSGTLAEAILRAEPDAQLDVLEVNQTLRDLLAAKRFNLVGRDFLDFEGGPYDAIIMNPPFEGDADIEHVRHAYDLLAPRGVLVSIMSASSFPTEAAREAGMIHEPRSRKRQLFHAWLEGVRGEWERNDADAFLKSARPVGVSTVTVVVRKPAAADEVGKDGENAEGMPGVSMTHAEVLELLEAARRRREAAYARANRTLAAAAARASELFPDAGTARNDAMRRAEVARDAQLDQAEAAYRRQRAAIQDAAGYWRVQTEGMPRPSRRDREFQDAYRITSTTGRLYTRAMLLDAASRSSLFRTVGVQRHEVAGVLDDDAWMRRHAGEVPARVIEDAIFEALVRRAGP